MRMATRTNMDVTIMHSDANKIARFLGEHASRLEGLGKRTRSTPVKDKCKQDAAESRRLALHITKNLWKWTS